ncbi:threonine-type endopeptidase [Aureococcus anophagefferens]|nr:threonine-type endopeptidase [Aureococcus anophagefferens]
MSRDSGFDHHITIFSPAGKLYQVEYAIKCAQTTSGLTSVAVRGRDSCVLVTQKKVPDRLVDPSSVTNLYKVTDYLAVLMTGAPADCKTQATRLRYEASEFKFQYGYAMPVASLAMRVGDICQVYTQRASLRALAAICIIAAVDDEKGPSSSRSTRRATTSPTLRRPPALKSEATNFLEKKVDELKDYDADAVVRCGISALQSVLNADFAPEIEAMVIAGKARCRPFRREIDAHLVLAETDACGGRRTPRAAITARAPREQGRLSETSSAYKMWRTDGEGTPRFSARKRASSSASPAADAVALEEARGDHAAASERLFVELVRCEALRRLGGGAPRPPVDAGEAERDAAEAAAEVRAALGELRASAVRLEAAEGDLAFAREGVARRSRALGAKIEDCEAVAVAADGPGEATGWGEVDERRQAWREAAALEAEVDALGGGAPAPRRAARARRAPRTGSRRRRRSPGGRRRHGRPRGARRPRRPGRRAGGAPRRLPGPRPREAAPRGDRGAALPLPPPDQTPSPTPATSPPPLGREPPPEDARLSSARPRRGSGASARARRSRRTSTPRSAAPRRRR